MTQEQGPQFDLRAIFNEIEILRKEAKANYRAENPPGNAEDIDDDQNEFTGNDPRCELLRSCIEINPQLPIEQEVEFDPKEVFGENSPYKGTKEVLVGEGIIMEEVGLNPDGVLGLRTKLLPHSVGFAGLFHGSEKAYIALGNFNNGSELMIGLHKFIKIDLIGLGIKSVSYGLFLGSELETVDYANHFKSKAEELVSAEFKKAELCSEHLSIGLIHAEDQKDKGVSVVIRAEQNSREKDYPQLFVIK